MTPIQAMPPVSKPDPADCAKPIFRWTEDSRIVRACDDRIMERPN